jgi:hypothetical protein
MIETTANIWDFEADVKCITTNGFLKKDGTAVMGAGVAKQAKLLYPALPEIVGQVLKTVGNHVIPVYRAEDAWLFTFPVKDHWVEDAKITLIKRSAHELLDQVEEINTLRGDRKIPLLQTIALPRPGCGNGQLEWEVVKPVLEPILDDRFVVVEIVKGA